MSLQVDPPSLAQRFKNTYDSLEELAKAKFDLSKAKWEATKPALVKSAVLAVVAQAFFVILLMAISIAGVTYAQESWGWGTTRSWAVAAGLLFVILALMLFALKNAIQKTVTLFEGKGDRNGHDYIN